MSHQIINAPNFLIEKSGALIFILCFSVFYNIMISVFQNTYIFYLVASFYKLAQIPINGTCSVK